MLSDILLKLKKAGNTVIVFLCLLISGKLHAQGENNHWFFGNRVHVDFNSTPPAVSASNMNALEGCSSVSNAAGTLLFYSDGRSVWDAAANVMPNGSGLLGNQVTSCAQGVNIMQFPDNPARYYLFVGESTLQGFGPSTTNGTVRYSVVDMSLNGGMGDIIPGQKNIELGSGYSEEMTFAHGPACNTAWFVIRDTASGIHAYHISPSGIASVPVVSNFPALPFTARIGEMKVSPDDSRIAWTVMSGGYARIADFNKSTGAVSNVQTITGLQSPYGLAFSPDNSKLYIATDPAVRQYDLSLLPNITAFLASAYTVTSAFLSYMSLRNGPDNKIYIVKNSNNPVFAINAPNIAGVGCSLNTNAIQTAPGTNPVIGLGAPPFIFPGYDIIAGIVTDSIVCFRDSVRVTAPPHYNAYQWSTGATGSSIYIHNNAVQWVALTSDTTCHTRIDSFKITFEDFAVDLGQDTMLCAGEALLLNAYTQNASYLWQDGQTQPAITIDTPGRYHVTVTRNACSRQDSVTVGSRFSYLTIQETDTMLCEGKRITLHAKASPGTSFLWNTGDMGAEITVDQQGPYILTGFSLCGTLSDSIRIVTEQCDCRPWIPTAFSPNADGLNDIFQIQITCNTFRNYWLTIYNRFGQIVFESRNYTKGWDGLLHGNPADLGTYFYRLSFDNQDGSDFYTKGDIMLIR